MTPGPTEEVGRVATTIVESLKTQPLMLAVILFNLIFLAVIYFGVTAQRAQNHEVMKVLLDQSTKAQELLSHCIVPHGEREENKGNS